MSSFVSQHFFQSAGCLNPASVSLHPPDHLIQECMDDHAELS